VRDDTIAAIATAPGRGGVGIVRVSGPACRDVAQGVFGRVPSPRQATFGQFRDSAGQPIDEGLALYFPGPHSFTGEDVLELHGHGGPIVLDMLLTRALSLGVSMARPGEFTERAFLNGKLDLAQAEAVADLIDSATTQAARLAVRSLEGELSRRVNALAEDLTGLRVFVEATLDFPDEQIDFIPAAEVSARLSSILGDVGKLKQSARVGRLLRDGMTVVIAGRPNAGKSSLMNALAGRDSAIVTDVPGTTRDLLREQTQIDGMPVHLIDTAGLRESTDLIEREGVRRARAEIERADLVLWVFDDRADPMHLALDRAEVPPAVPLVLVRNKVDLTGTPIGLDPAADPPEIALSARTGAGIDRLRRFLKERMGYRDAQEGEFIARRRHLDAIERAEMGLRQAVSTLADSASLDLVAEDLRSAQRALGEITGAVTPDDLLDRIFASFCIGK